MEAITPREFWEIINERGYSKSYGTFQIEIQKKNSRGESWIEERDRIQKAKSKEELSRTYEIERKMHQNRAEVYHAFGDKVLTLIERDVDRAINDEEIEHKFSINQLISIEKLRASSLQRATELTEANKKNRNDETDVKVIEAEFEEIIEAIGASKMKEIEAEMRAEIAEDVEYSKMEDADEVEG